MELTLSFLADPSEPFKDSLSESSIELSLSFPTLVWSLSSNSAQGLSSIDGWKYFETSNSWSFFCNHISRLHKISITMNTIVLSRMTVTKPNLLIVGILMWRWISEVALKRIFFAGIRSRMGELSTMIMIATIVSKSAPAVLVLALVHPVLVSVERIGQIRLPVAAWMGWIRKRYVLLGVLFAGARHHDYISQNINSETIHNTTSASNQTNWQFVRTGCKPLILVHC